MLVLEVELALVFIIVLVMVPVLVKVLQPKYWKGFLKVGYLHSCCFKVQSLLAHSILEDTFRDNQSFLSEHPPLSWYWKSNVNWLKQKQFFAHTHMDAHTQHTQTPMQMYIHFKNENHCVCFYRSNRGSPIYNGDVGVELHIQWRCSATWVYQNSTNQYHTIPHTTTHYHTMPHNTTQYHTLPHNTTQYHTLPHNVIQYHTIPYTMVMCSHVGLSPRLPVHTPYPVRC